MVKVSTLNHSRVVYACNDDWDNYHQYTSTLTDNEYLIPGWKRKTIKIKLKILICLFTFLFFVL